MEQKIRSVPNTSTLKQQKVEQETGCRGHASHNQGMRTWNLW